MPQPNLSILDAMAILTEAWGRDSEETIRKCFRKAGIGNQAQQSALNDDEDRRGTQRQFSENICSEDDLRSRIFGTFVVKFLACLPLLGFSNIYKMV